MDPATAPFEPYLQRRSEQRLLADWSALARADPDSLYLLAHGTTQLVRRDADADAAEIAFLGPTDPLVTTLADSQMVLLGWFHGRRCVLVDLQSRHAPPPGTEFEELRALLPLLAADHAHLLTYARALLIWRSRHRHCGVCGAPTAARSAGHVLVCSNGDCGTEFFPRIDPAIIVLVTHARQALLGRQATWAPGRYSTLAGFVEPGESLEAAVAREVEEETGIRVERVRYFASQPWPFPSSLMLGFHAQATPGPVRLNGELEDARWFELDALRAAAAGTLPPPFTIARRLIDAWLADHGEPHEPA